MQLHIRKRKIFNDPVYGFITIPYEIIFDLIEHPYFQRLRRISQLGLTNLVYSGGHHTRFQHAIGAVHLMGKAIEVIRSKGHEITEEEAVGVSVAILLHDIGHGPFSHTLERSIVTGISHEDISLLLMDELNREFEGKLDIAIQIFKNEYPKNFLYQLVSGQLDMDRLDYLRRDSFFTGVSEGVIGVDRIIKMLDVVNDELVVEAKGIYSVEKFLVARRLMYWQVYLHKTVIAAEQMLMRILERARQLAIDGNEVPCSRSLKVFLYGNFHKSDFIKNKKLLKHFAQLDDYDVMAAIKEWQHASDMVLSKLSKMLVKRELLKVQMQREPFPAELKELKLTELCAKWKISKEEAQYFVFTESINNMAYQNQQRINLLYKDGSVKDIAEAADLLNISALSESVTKHFICFPKGSKI
ncbi:MAG: HD domain-containing protein [Flavobacteriales bacterium]|nr:HD domain-containing protein [Flavobacteriales bacterium]